MCELFAANLQQPQALNAQLSTFFGDANMHPHGWGLAVREDSGSLTLRKEARRATDSRLLGEILRQPVCASHVLAHIRYATAGHVSYDNTHPFEGRDAAGTKWAFVHNGSIFHQKLIEPFSFQARGQSDSERVLLYLIDVLNHVDAANTQDAARGAKAAGGNPAGKASGFGRRFEALSLALAALSAGNKLNVILDDGTYTYVHTNTEDDTLYFRQDKNGVLFCTRPLDEAGWQPLPKCRLLAYRDGRLAQVAPALSATYHFDQGQLDAFLLANAA